MKVLYVGLLHNYGKREEGFSYENSNIEAGFRSCNLHGLFQTDYYFPDYHDEYALKQFMFDTRIYDAIFHVAFNESLDLPLSLAKDALKNNIPVIQWDCDSSWRFQNWILPRKNRVSHFVTTHKAALPWYIQNGMNVQLSQWAGSPLYKKQNLDKIYDITFIGQKHGDMGGGKFVRSEIISALQNAGLDVHIFGNYWDGQQNWHGYIREFHEIVRIINQSKICLNLSNPWHTGTMPQIKGRHFELPQCGAFQITTPADDLESYFMPDKEIIIANSIDDLIDKCYYYLRNDDERDKVAQAGHQRMMADHQWEQRLTTIFKNLCLI